MALEGFLFLKAIRWNKKIHKPVSPSHSEYVWTPEGIMERDCPHRILNSSNVFVPANIFDEECSCGIYGTLSLDTLQEYLDLGVGSCVTALLLSYGQALAGPQPESESEISVVCEQAAVVGIVMYKQDNSDWLMYSHKALEYFQTKSAIVKAYSIEAALKACQYQLDYMTGTSKYRIMEDTE